MFITFECVFKAFECMFKSFEPKFRTFEHSFLLRIRTFLLVIKVFLILYPSCNGYDYHYFAFIRDKWWINLHLLHCSLNFLT